MNKQELAVLQDKIQKMLDECDWTPPVLCTLEFHEKFEMIIADPQHEKS